MSRLMLSVLFAVIWIPVLGIAQTPSSTPAAQAPAVIGPAKIAWINLEQAVLTSDEGKAMVAEIQKWVDAKNVENETMKKEADALKNQLSVQGSKLTDEARGELEDQIEAKETTLQRFQQDTQKEIEAKKNKMTNYLARRMQPVVEKLAKEKGISAILILSSARDAFVDQSMIITEEVIKAYNQTYPVSGAKAPASAPKAAPSAPAPKNP